MGTLREKVIEQEIAGMPMENFIADALAQLDKAQIDKEQSDMKVAFLKQLNNRHKNIIDAQRVELKQLEFERNSSMFGD